MDRETRKLGHIKFNKILFSTSRPGISDLQEGDHVEVLENGVLKLYTKRHGNVYSYIYTKEM
jgi:hypothetical protein